MKSKPINETKLIAFMKKFIGTTKNDPEESKYFKIENGVNYSATNLHRNCSMAVFVELENIELWQKGTGVNEFAKPIDKDTLETVEDVIGYPEVKNFFEKFDPNGFITYNINVDDLEELTKVNEALIDLSKVNKSVFVGDLSFCESKLIMKSKHSKVDFLYTYEVDEVINFKEEVTDWYYDPSLLDDCLKAFKGLKPQKLELLVKDNHSPLYLIAENDSYKIKAAIQRKLTMEV